LGSRYQRRRCQANRVKAELAFDMRLTFSYWSKATMPKKATLLAAGRDFGLGPSTDSMRCNKNVRVVPFASSQS
jgi:hypothetical protein